MCYLAGAMIGDLAASFGLHYWDVAGAYQMFGLSCLAHRKDARVLQ